MESFRKIAEIVLANRVYVVRMKNHFASWNNENVYSKFTI